MTTIPLQLEEGDNSIILKYADGEVIPIELDPNNDDSRLLAIAIGPIEIVSNVNHIFFK